MVRRRERQARARGLIRVVTAQHEAAEKLQKRSRLDPATGALNRASLSEHIDELLEGAQRRSTESFVVLLAGAPFETDAGPVCASLRIGGAIAPRHGRSAQILYQHAEEALDLARQAGARRFAAFEPSLSASDVKLRVLRTADDILAGLNQGRITLAL
jgi:GGDEF domain-containing protein